MPRNFSEQKSGGDNSYTESGGRVPPPVPHRSTPACVCVWGGCGGGGVGVGVRVRVLQVLDQMLAKNHFLFLTDSYQPQSIKTQERLRRVSYSGWTSNMATV